MPAGVSTPYINGVLMQHANAGLGTSSISLYFLLLVPCVLIIKSLKEKKVALRDSGGLILQEEKAA